MASIIHADLVLNFGPWPVSSPSGLIEMNQFPVPSSYKDDMWNWEQVMDGPNPFIPVIYSSTTLLLIALAVAIALV
jgi:hypothetical protein